MNWNPGDLDNIPTRAGLIPAGDDRIERYAEDTMMRGHPDAVLIARDEQEVADALSYCNAHKIPVTLCGSQTSETGSSVALEGLLISTERLEGVIDISKSDAGATATVRPGTIVADFQRAVSNAGFFYPVAPTSRDECRIGANVATNASGEDSYRYGTVRKYVRSLELILPDGTKRTLDRAPGESPSLERNRAGYFADWKNPIDLIIGSEGTLGFVTEITFDLLPAAKPFFSALIPFISNWSAIDFAMKIALGKIGLRVRALELIDSGALEMMKTAESFPNLADEVCAFLYVKQEYDDDSERDLLLSRWLDAITSEAGDKLAEQILIADTPSKQEAFRLWRHRIPELAGETGRSFWAQGGAKIGSDWWVPVAKIPEMFKHFYATAEATGLTYMGYAHIGVGNPHTNILAKNAAEKKIALDALLSCCKKAVELGGGVAGEHGVGKLHTDLVPVQHPAAIIEQMKQWKREYDPNWILGRGNIFESWG